MRRPTRSEHAKGYAIAVGSVAVAACVRWMLDGITTLPFVTFFPAVLVSGWWGGGGPALLSVVLSAAAGAAWWLTSSHAVLPSTASHFADVILFAGIGSAIGLLAARLRSVRRRFQSVLESMTDGFAVIDREWRFVYVNPAAARFVGKRPTDFVGRRIWDLFPHAEQGAFGQAARAAMAGTVTDYTAFNDQVGLWFQATVHPVAEGIAFISKDVTAAKELEHRRAELLAQLEVTNRLKDEFLATLSHELRTPLNALLGWAAMMTEGAAPTSRALPSIVSNAHALRRLIEDLLDSSRVAAGKLHMEMQATDLRRVIADAVDTVRVTVDNNHLTLLFEGVEDPVFVMGDGARLRQAVVNVVGNAVKFTPTGGCVEVTLVVEDGHARLTVRDSGVGITTELLPRVFDRFVQGDAGPTHPSRGLGLGLAITKHIVDAHGGTITVESDGPMQGTTFELAFPVLAQLTEVGPEAPRIHLGLQVGR
jgi:PAS domain S-box-containing protein